MVPLLSASTSLIMSCNSDSEGFWPRERITVPNSLVVIWPVLVYKRQHRCLSYYLKTPNRPWINQSRAGGGKKVNSSTDHRHPCPIDTKKLDSVSFKYTKFEDIGEMDHSQTERRPPCTQRLVLQSTRRPMIVVSNRAEKGMLQHVRSAPQSGGDCTEQMGDGRIAYHDEYEGNGLKGGLWRDLRTRGARQEECVDRKRRRWMLVGCARSGLRGPRRD